MEAVRVGRSQCEEMNRLRHQYGLKPLLIHANYLVNLAGGNPEFRAKSIVAFRGEVERALAFGAEFLVLHLARSAEAVAKKDCSGLRWPLSRRSRGWTWPRAIAHPDREHGRIGVFPRRQLRAGC